MQAAHRVSLHVKNKLNNVHPSPTNIAITE